MPQVALPSASTIRVIYAVPAGAPDRFGEAANAITSDVAAIDQWWQLQDPTREPRWDLYPFPGCTVGLADLDLGVVHLGHDAAFYAVSSGYERVVDELAPSLGVAEKALVFFDGAFADPLICGTSEQAPRNGGAYGVSVVTLRSECGSDLGAGGYTARVAVHELVHNLGATPVVGPPNRCVDPRLAGHVCDSESDLMYPYAFAGMRLGDAVLDIDHDDYYEHSGQWWDVQDSPWLVHLPLRTLTVNVSGPGSVSSAPEAIECVATCTVSLETDYPIRLVAAAGPGAELYGWRGACSGETACALTMTGDLSVEAVFGPRRPRLTVRVVGRGTVTSVPGGIHCPGRCVAPYPRNASVKLRQRPAAGWKLERWSGGCARKPSCTLALAADRSETVTFKRAGK